jgi:hypothetical protein
MKAIRQRSVAPAVVIYAQKWYHNDGIVRHALSNIVRANQIDYVVMKVLADAA